MRIFSAIRPSGKLQLGNYFGAIKQWVKLQEEGDCVFAIADYHAITTDFEPDEIRKHRKDYLSYFFAAGLVADKSIMFIQSQNPDHPELAWILNSVAKESELKRMTQYKEKASEEKSISAGLLNYPILQASDILLYKTDTVPVGEDQVQHVEFARKLARKFNNRFGEVFVEPEAKVLKAGARIMSLTDPTSKMSKSGSEKSKINLSDDPQKAKSKIMSAVTDSGKEIKQAKDKPAITNLINIYHLLMDKSVKKIEADYEGRGYGDFKDDLGSQVAEFLSTLQERRKTVLDKGLVESSIDKGLSSAHQISQPVLIEAKKAIGVLD